jgi:hypothetical protein
LGVVIDVTSELMNSPDDGRVTVAPLVPRAAVTLDWEQVLDGKVAGTMALPAVQSGSIRDGFPPADWPDVLLAARSVTTLTRRIVEAGRMMTLTPRMGAVLAAKLAEMFGARQWVRMRHFDNVEGRVLVQVDDIGRLDPPPTDGKWAILHFDNHERMHVFVNARK